MTYDATFDGLDLLGMAALGVLVFCVTFVIVYRALDRTTDPIAQHRQARAALRRVHDRRRL
jgi:hypothetical protein